ncbi:mediator complex subunit 13 C-terminal-domain-containing protein [Aspergillus pseudoustus]|uniref:Mediator of RNA polymerase II transcription subunit 13 n=1 Tax=Aspergillus pseudoustus TaxID=1810923 RepID=A0ABR4KUR0_9EURO
MEFPGGSITNIRVIDGFSNIYWRIYTEDTGSTNPPADGIHNGHTILKHISRLKELELRLRSLGCLVLSYPRRRGLLIFSATPDFEHLSPLLPNDKTDESNRLYVGSTTLKVWTSGSVSSADLTKSLRSDIIQTTSANSPAASQRLQSGPAPPRRVDNSGGSAAIYASFISAVTAAFSVQIVRQNSAIPLGPRALFNTVESDADEDHGFLNDGPTSVSALTSLQVQLTSNGKLTVALQTITQNGLTRLSEPEGDSTEISDVSPGTDLWLAPNGSIARLVAMPLENNGSPPSFSGFESEWKSNVRQWLSYFGLPIDFISDEGWVEVEVWEPFYAKLSGEAARPKVENSPLPLKRIMWPAAYCFSRTKSTLPAAFDCPDATTSFGCDPLEFAESWCSKEIPKTIETNAKLPSEQERKATAQNTFSPGQSNFPEGIESLSRASLFADLQTASLVYPTPPEGTTGIGVHPVASADIFAEDSDQGSSLLRSQNPQQHDIRLVGKDRSGSDVTMGFGPSAGLAVGSGLYDTNEDDDLFGDMNGRDFGTKGITDADFSFFDDPDFDPAGNNPIGDDMNVDEIEEIPDFVDTSKPGGIQVPEFEVPAPSKATIDDSNVPQPSSEKLATTPPDQPISDASALASSPHHERIQTISPPLSPVEVKKILFPEPAVSAQPFTKSTHASSYYSPVTFRNNISSWDKKYGIDGKFAFTEADTSLSNDPHRPSNGIPTIGLPRRKSNLKMPASSTTLGGQGSPPIEATQELLSNVASSSETDDESDESDLENNIPSMASITLKRKRAPSFSASSTGPSSEKNPTTSDPELAIMPKTEDSVFLGNFLSTFSDWSITGFFSLTENQVFSTLTSREMQVEVAQLLVDQITQSTLDHKLDGKLGVSYLDNQAFCLQELLEGTDFLGGFEKLDLNSFVSLQEQSALSPSALNAPTPRLNAQRKDSGKGSITKLTPPHLRVRRGKDYLETLPPAVSFWETFGLEPAHGPKDITGYCIHPLVATKAADAFLERLALLYTGCSLGNHTRGDDSSFFDKGLGGWDANSSRLSNYQTSIQQLRDICEELGTALLNGTPSRGNIVIYVINPFSHAASLVDICAAFWCLLQKYAADAAKQQSKQLHGVVLQIIPMDFVTSRESLVVPPQTDYLNLALEIYSRCSPRESQGSLINCTPPMVLAEPIPPSIVFKLASERASPLQEGKCLHVACSRSHDQRWISVAWSDNAGIVQRTVSYCLRFRESRVSRNLSTIRSEIWNATREILDRDQARWRIILVSTENVDQDEHDTWLNLVEQFNKTRSIPVELTMLTVNTNPDLFLSPPLPPLSMNVLNPQVSSTPVATPLPSGAVLSPDQLGNASTPPGGGNIPVNAPTPTDALFESDAEILLSDICDESWAVVLSHRLNGTLHLTEYRPALASGYLVRRKGATDADGAYTMNVNILYTQRTPSSYETLLREILGMYRDLATLARVRGTRIVQRGTLPWHIATAVRAQEVLSYVL